MSKETETRKCIVSKEVKEKENLLRFVADNEGRIIPDFKKKLQGKGVYVSNSKKALMEAVDKNLFAKALKLKVRAGTDLIDMVENILKKSGLEAVSLSKKAGVLVTGFEKVKEALKKDKIAFVLEAKDAGDDGHNKIVSLAKNLELFDLYSVEELDKVLGKTNTVHAAFMKSDAAKMVYAKLHKLKTFLNS